VLHPLLSRPDHLVQTSWALPAVLAAAVRQSACQQQLSDLYWTSCQRLLSPSHVHQQQLAVWSLSHVQQHQQQQQQQQQQRQQQQQQLAVWSPAL
jgi:hypothetical protein